MEGRQFYLEENEVEAPSHLSSWPQPSHVSKASCDRNRNAGLLWVATCPSKSVVLWEVLSPKAGREEGRLDGSCQARSGLQGGWALPILDPGMVWPHWSPVQIHGTFLCHPQPDSLATRVNTSWGRMGTPKQSGLGQSQSQVSHSVH